MTNKPQVIRTLARFQKEITELKDGEFVYRGQSYESWPVNSAAYRRLFSKRKRQKPLPNELIKYNKDLIDNARNYNEAPEGEMNLELLAQLQHQGGATNLIDFSYSALIALWFACQDSTKNGKVFCLKTSDVKTCLVISLEDKKELIEKILTLDLRDNKDIKIAKWQPPFRSNRIIKQDSVFIFNKSGEIQNKDFNKVLIISRNCKENILEDLEMLSGITEPRIFPDFYGFAQSNAYDKPHETETAEDIFKRALDHHQAGRLEEAIKDYDRAIELDPNYTDAYYNRGGSKAGLKQFEEATKDYDRVIELDPNYADAYNNRGVSKAGLKQFEEAIKDYNRTIELDPNYADAYNNRGGSKAGLKQFEEAIKDYDRAIELDPNYVAAYCNRGSAKTGLKQFEEAIKDYNRTIELDPDNTTAYNNRGTAKAGLKQFEEAIKDYNRAVELDPNDAEIYNNRGNAKVLLKQHEEAIKDYDRAIKLNSNYANAYYNRGTAKLSLGHLEEAIRDIEQAKDMYNKQDDLEKVKACRELIDALKNQ